MLGIAHIKGNVIVCYLKTSITCFVINPIRTMWPLFRVRAQGNREWFTNSPTWCSLFLSICEMQLITMVCALSLTLRHQFLHGHKIWHTPCLTVKFVNTWSKRRKVSERPKFATYIFCATYLKSLHWSYVELSKRKRNRMRYYRGAGETI